MGRSIQNIEISFTEKDITHYGGLYLIHKFCKICKIKWYLQSYVKLHQRNQEYSTAEFILILIYMIIAGIGRIEDVKNLGYNGVIKKILGIKKLGTDMDILVSWNYAHIVRFKTQQIVRAINIGLGFSDISINTPMEVIIHE